MLGFVSMFMDISSEIIHSLLPMFLVTSLGASAVMVGLIEGVAEAAAPIVKVFSGALSDYLGNRKWLAVIGYGLGALSKPLFALAPTAGFVLTARVVDRIGKGASARVFEVHRATRSWPTSHPCTCVARLMAFDNHSIRSAHFLGPCLRLY
jgi:MFS family permease